jgi:hypothetical protein
VNLALQLFAKLMTVGEKINKNKLLIHCLAELISRSFLSEFSRSKLRSKGLNTGFICTPSSTITLENSGPENWPMCVQLYLGALCAQSVMNGFA